MEARLFSNLALCFILGFRHFGCFTSLLELELYFINFNFN